MSLSDKIVEDGGNQLLFTEDVKEFIKDLKKKVKEMEEKIYYKYNNLDFRVGMDVGFKFAMHEIDKLIGEKLTGKPVDLSGGRS